MFHQVSSRFLFFLAFVGCLMILAVALYLEYFVGLQPCPLCTVQRIAVGVFGVVCLLAAIHGPSSLGMRLYALLSLVFSAAGLAAAGRQIWLQSLPADQLEACLPSWEFMLEAFPVHEILTLVFKGTADCAEISWTLFGLSLPEMSLLGFIGMSGFALFLLVRRA